jgi:peptidoglycan hydrolase CwlO-like protein
VTVAGNYLRKMRKNKINSKKVYFKIASLLNLSVSDVFNHVQKLYQEIHRQRKRIKQLQFKIKKLVNFVFISGKTVVLHDKHLSLSEIFIETRCTHC